VKVMVVGPTKPPSGGIATIINDLIGSSIGNKIELMLLDTSKRTPKNRKLWQGIKSQLTIIREYAKMIRSRKPDIVHIHSGGYIDFYRKSIDVLLARLLGSKPVLHNHGGDFNEFIDNGSFLRRMYVKFVLRRCARVIVLSQWWKDFHSKLVPAEKVSILYNGINSAPYFNAMPRSKARHILRIPRDKMFFLTLGVKGKRKGAFDIVEAAPLVKRAFDNALLMLVGPDEDIAQGATQQLADLRAKLEVEDIVDLQGEADERVRHILYAAADCFLLPSYAENSPVSIIEAMASGLPVISSTVGAIPELIDDGRTGILVPPGMPGQIAEAIITLCKDENLRKSMGRAGYDKFRKHYDMEHAFVQDLWCIYREIAGGDPAHSGPPEAAAEAEEKPDEEAGSSQAGEDVDAGQTRNDITQPNEVPDIQRRLEDAADQVDFRT